MTPGYKTSEFWITVVVVALGALMSSGLLAGDSSVMRVAGVVMSTLKALGYTASRTLLKAQEPDDAKETP